MSSIVLFLIHTYTLFLFLKNAKSTKSIITFNPFIFLSPWSTIYLPACLYIHIFNYFFSKLRLYSIYTRNTEA